MNDYVKGVIRTLVTLGVGAVLSWLAAKTGIVVDEQTSGMGVGFFTAVVTGGWYVLAAAIERRYPGIGKVLVGLGAGSAPTYRPARVIPGRVEPPSR